MSKEESEMSFRGHVAAPAASEMSFQGKRVNPDRFLRKGKGTKKVIPMTAPMVHSSEEVKLSAVEDSRRCTRAADVLLDYLLHQDCRIAETAFAFGRQGSTNRGKYLQQRVAIFSKLDWRDLRSKINLMMGFDSYLGSENSF